MTSTLEDRFDTFNITGSTAEAPDDCWRAFQKINGSRRAVRDFDGSPIPDREIEALLREALLAPSSGNGQPYEIHWVRDPAMKAAVASACRNQRAARSASTLLVFVCGARFALETISIFRCYVETTPELSERSRAYHLKEVKSQSRFLHIAASILCSPVASVVSAAFPCFSLLPLGAKGVRQWAARSALFAAQTLLLAASARGFDTCPMEGFDPRKLARALGLQRGDVIPIVVALGRRRPDARIEPRWRRPFEVAVQIR